MHLPWTFGTLGSSLPMAIGAKVAFPERQVVTLCGDGALMFTLPELATVMWPGPHCIAMAALNAARAQDVPEAESQSTLYIAAYGFGLFTTGGISESDYASPATRS